MGHVPIKAMPEYFKTVSRNKEREVEEKHISFLCIKKNEKSEKRNATSALASKIILNKTRSSAGSVSKASTNQSIVFGPVVLQGLS